MEDNYIEQSELSQTTKDIIIEAINIVIVMVAKDLVDNEIIERVEIDSD